MNTNITYPFKYKDSFLSFILLTLGVVVPLTLAGAVNFMPLPGRLHYLRDTYWDLLGIISSIFVAIVYLCFFYLSYQSRNGKFIFADDKVIIHIYSAVYEIKYTDILNTKEVKKIWGTYAYNIYCSENADIGRISIRIESKRNILELKGIDAVLIQKVNKANRGRKGRIISHWLH